MERTGHTKCVTPPQLECVEHAQTRTNMDTHKTRATLHIQGHAQNHANGDTHKTTLDS